MKPVAGVFTSRADAERVARNLLSMGFSKDRITMLAPGKENEKQVQSVPVNASEQPGMATVLGTVVGATAGLAGGMGLGAATLASVPGVGPVIAVGLVGAALLGLAGAEVGSALDAATTEGLPEDELFVYEDALRKGRSVVLAFAKDDTMAKFAREVMKSEGADSIDTARKQWWIGLRSAEKEHYAALGKDFEKNEDFYRLGFEAALRTKFRCKEYDQVLAEMGSEIDELQERYPNAEVEQPFRRGFERGRVYYEALCGKTKRAA